MMEMLQNEYTVFSNVIKHIILTHTTITNSKTIIDDTMIHS